MILSTDPSCWPGHALDDLYLHFSEKPKIKSTIIVGFVLKKIKKKRVNKARKETQQHTHGSLCMCVITGVSCPIILFL